MNDHKLDDRSTYGIYRPLTPHRQLAFRVINLSKATGLDEYGPKSSLRDKVFKDTAAIDVIKISNLERRVFSLESFKTEAAQGKEPLMKHVLEEVRPKEKVELQSKIKTEVTQARKTLEALQKAGVAEKDANVLVERALEAKVADPKLRQEMMVALKKKQEVRIRNLAGEEGEKFEDEEKIHEEQEHITKEEEAEEKIYYVRDEQTSYNRALAGENAIREVYRHLGKIDCRLAATLISDSLVSAILMDQPGRFDGSLAALKEKFAATDNITNPEEAVMLFNRLNYNLPPVAESYEPRNIVDTLAAARVWNNRKAQIVLRETLFDTTVFMG